MKSPFEGVELHQELVSCAGCIRKYAPRTSHQCVCGEVFDVRPDGHIPVHDRRVVWFNTNKYQEWAGVDLEMTLMRRAIRADRITVAVSPFVATVVRSFTLQNGIRGTNYGRELTELILSKADGKFEDQKILTVLLDGCEVLQEVRQVFDDYLKGKL